MTKKLTIAGAGIAAVAALTIALAPPAIARGPMDRAGGFAGAGIMGGPGGGLFAVQFTDLDTDGDGSVTEAELAARAEALAAERLAGIDADGDGTVTAEELEAGILARIDARGQGRRGIAPAEVAGVMADRLLAARDADGDGALSGAELSPAADVAALVDRFDSDDDNAWSAEEFAQVRLGRGFDDRGRGGWDQRGAKWR